MLLDWLLRKRLYQFNGPTYLFGVTALTTSSGGENDKPEDKDAGGKEKRKLHKIKVHYHSEDDKKPLDLSPLNEAGEYGSAVADLNKALRAYQEGDYKLVSMRVLRVAASLADLEAGVEFLDIVEDGGELKELLESEQYLKLLSKLVKLIPPTGEPEIDIPLKMLQSLEFVRLRLSWDLAMAGDYRAAAGEMGAAVLPRSFEEALHNTRPATVAPVAAGLVAGYYGYKGRLGRGARSNFILASFSCTASIRLVRVYLARLSMAKTSGRPVLYTGLDEWLLLT